MRESLIWKLVLATIIFAAVLAVLTSFDTGFFSVISQTDAIAVSTGNRIEIVVPQRAPLSGQASTDIYWLAKDASVTKRRSFEGVPQCVTAIGDKLFLGFPQDGGSIFKNGEWYRGVATPPGMTAYDVAAIADRIYAFGPVADGSKIGVKALTESGWEEPAPPFDTAKKLTMVTSSEVSGGIEVLYGTGDDRRIAIGDFKDVRWYHVRFDGKQWDVEKRIDFGEAAVPCMSSYEGAPAFVLAPARKGAPVKVVTLKDDKPVTAAEIPTAGMGAVASGWLVPLGGDEHVILTTVGSIWDARLDGKLKVLGTKKLVSVNASSVARTSIYVALFALVAVLFVSLGLAWLFVRISKMRGGT